MNRTTRKTLLTGCGRSFQFFGALGLAGALIGVLARVVNSTWPPVLSNGATPLGNIAALLLLGILSLLAIVHGHRAMKGNVTAVRWLAGLGWLTFAVATYRLISIGTSWDELGVGVLLLIDGHIALYCAEAGKG